MYTDKINISEDGKVYYVPYIWDKSPEYPYNDKRAAVVFFPGGGYEMTSDREAEPMALQYFAAGFNVFVVRYRVARESGFPNPLVDAMKAMKDIRANAEKYNIFPDKIAICGFSAGGHLTALLADYWNNEEFCGLAGVKPEEIKPNAAILYYPVILAFKNTHQGTILNIMQGHDGDEELLDMMSLEKHVTKDNPVTFICSTFNDGAVPILSSIKYAEALYNSGVGCEIHIIQEGNHGLATGDRLTNGITNKPAADWTKQAICWLRKNFEFLN